MSIPDFPPLNENLSINKIRRQREKDDSAKSKGFLLKPGKCRRETLVWRMETETVKTSKPNSQSRSKTRIHRPHHGVGISTSAISKFLKKAVE
jgi:hypothetical protein